MASRESSPKFGGLECLTLMRRLYVVTRDLHLYFGLFVSPFVLLFAVSVFYLAHPTPDPIEPDVTVRRVAGVAIPPNVAELQGRTRIDALRSVLDALGVNGEVDYVRHVANERRLVIPVKMPGQDSTVDLDYGAGTATVTTRGGGYRAALIYLHKMPGPHNADLRGNAAFMRAWRLLADATVYAFLFITLSGVYLWYALKAERRVGLALLSAGFVSFAGLVYVIAR